MSSLMIAISLHTVLNTVQSRLSNVYQMIQGKENYLNPKGRGQVGEGDNNFPY